LRVEDRSNGDEKFSPWKDSIVLLLEELDLWDIVDKVVTIPIDATLLDKYNKNNVKAKRIILDAIKYHLIPYITGKINAFDMWEDLTRIYQSSNENKKMILQEKLRNTKMTKNDTISSYHTKIT